ncbi:radical SAM protein [Carboxylicivirga taeanensis]|uniref:radical SAM protein n=1 Tax=Carboxylicivirga taeanensis TaxID=1416875 RepID=UPI003F6E3F7B
MQFDNNLTMKNYLNFYGLIKLYHSIKSRRLKIIGLYIIAKLGFRHLSLRIDPSLSCNLMCQMCYFSNREIRKSYRGSFTNEDMQNIAKIFFPKAIQVVLGCGAEPTMNSNFMKLLVLACEHKVPNISIVTNGLLLRTSQIEKMQEVGVDEIIISAHGLTKETYEKFMTNSNFDKFISLLDSITKLNKKDKALKVRINYTANNDNLDDLALLPSFLDRFDIKTVQIRPIMDIGGKYKETITHEKLPKYTAVIDSLISECKKREVSLLVNTSDTAYKNRNNDSTLVESIYTYISPKILSELSIGKEINSLQSYKKNTKWYRKLISGFFKDNSSDKNLERSLKYDIH